MQRRDLLKGGAAGLLAGLTAAARAADLPTIRWRLQSSFPKNLDTIYGAGEVLAERLRQITDGKFQVRVFAAGEIVGGLQVLDAVQGGTIECGHTASYYYVGKNLAFAFDCALPFGLTSRQQASWMYAGNGLKLTREFLKDYNIIQFPGGNTGVQMGGWFRKEIKSLADLGPQDAYPRARRPDPGQARRGTADHRRWRHLSGARARRDRRHRVGWPV